MGKGSIQVFRRPACLPRQSGTHYGGVCQKSAEALPALRSHAARRNKQQSREKSPEKRRDYRVERHRKSCRRRRCAAAAAHRTEPENGIRDAKRRHKPARSRAAGRIRGQQKACGKVYLECCGKRVYADGRRHRKRRGLPAGIPKHLLGEARRKGLRHHDGRGADAGAECVPAGQIRQSTRGAGAEKAQRPVQGSLHRVQPVLHGTKLCPRLAGCGILLYGLDHMGENVPGGNYTDRKER